MPVPAVASCVTNAAGLVRLAGRRSCAGRAQRRELPDPVTIGSQDIPCDRVDPRRRRARATHALRGSRPPSMQRPRRACDSLRRPARTRCHARSVAFAARSRRPLGSARRHADGETARLRGADSSRRPGGRSRARPGSSTSSRLAPTGPRAARRRSAGEGSARSAASTRRRCRAARPRGTTPGQRTGGRCSDRCPRSPARPDLRSQPARADRSSRWRSCGSRPDRAAGAPPRRTRRAARRRRPKRPRRPGPPSHAWRR